MRNYGKCPYCQKLVKTVQVENIEIATGLPTSYKGASYSCPSCSAVLGVEMDPIALKADIIEEVIDALRRG